MLGREDEPPVPPPASLSEAPERVTEFAYALSDPERTALMSTLVAGGPQTVAQLAEAAGQTEDTVRLHLKVLVSAGLAATARTGLSRRRIYTPTVADLEVRFFTGERTKRARERTVRHLRRDAKRRARRQRRLDRIEKRLAKERRG